MEIEPCTIWTGMLQEKEVVHTTPCLDWEVFLEI